MKSTVKSLIVQPGDGVKPLVEAIEAAEKSIQIVIFRFDAGQLEKALINAAQRGVFVHAMVAHVNDKGEAPLRKLELRLLEQGITVARTGSDLLRYHDKLMIIDGKTLYLLGFNYTYDDMNSSRSFGIVTKHKPWVTEAVKLFMADATRQAFEPEEETFLVSPLNSRPELARLLKSAEKELLIYDKKLSDPAMLELLEERMAAGVDVRILGGVPKKVSGFNTCKLSKLRLHTRTIVVDGKRAFVGSQSLRTLELDARREVGLIIDDPDTVSRLHKIFEEDWAASHKPAPGEATEADEPEEFAELETLELALDAAQLKAALKEAVREVMLEQAESEEGALKEMIKEVVQEVMAETLPPKDKREAKRLPS